MAHRRPRPARGNRRTLASFQWTTIAVVVLQALLVVACGSGSTAPSLPPPDAGPVPPADARLVLAPDVGAGGVPAPDGLVAVDAAPDIADGSDAPDTPLAHDALATVLDAVAPPDLGLDAARTADAVAPRDSGADVAPPPDMAVDLGPPPAPEQPFSVMRVLPWVGGGLQMAVELPPGRPAPDGLPEFWMQTAAEPRVDTVVAGAAVTEGITAILLVPAEDPGEHLMRRIVADVLLDLLPPGERVAVLMAGDEVELLAELSIDRAHAHAQLARFRSEPGRSAAPLMTTARSMVEDLESRFTSLGRTLIVIGEAVEETPPGELRPVQTLSLGAIADLAADPAALASLHQARRAAIVRVGACPGLAADEVFALHAGARSVVLESPEPMAHLAGEACDAARAAADDYPFPTEISLAFSPEERALYDTYSAAGSPEPFTTSVTLGLGLAIPAAAHFHGMGTLGCERKSITVELDGPRRRLAPDLAADRFILISMCQDLRYFGQVFGNRLLASLGLFPSPFKYVRLRVDGVNRGVYMMVYQPERAFRDTSLGLASVVRRGYDIDAWPAEVKYPADPVAAEEARLRFEAIGDLALSEAPDRLSMALDARLDFDAYLRLLAVFSLLENGDFIDEAFFASSLEVDAERYRVMAWDTDDLWSACHAEGARAIVDPCGLTYCTEAELDQSMMRSTEVYRRYLEALSDILTTLSPERLAATMDEVRAELWGVLVDDETAAACTEMVAENPATISVEAARADIAGVMAAMLAQTERRREALSAALAACPDAAPTP